MDSYSALQNLNIISAVSAGFAFVFAVIATVIFMVKPPEKMKQIIQEAKILADPKRRKAVASLDPGQKELLSKLSNAPDISHLKGWLGTYSGKEV